MDDAAYLVGADVLGHLRHESLYHDVRFTTDHVSKWGRLQSPDSFNASNGMYIPANS
jgi:hypothetical protein